MHQQRGRYRRETEAGKRSAVRAAAAAGAAAAATVLQKYVRRWRAQRRVRVLSSLIIFAKQAVRRVPTVYKCCQPAKPAEAS